MSHLLPTALFSPSVARQQLLAAKDWSYVDAWLSTKYGGKPPAPFERNSDTLKALLALAAQNETADEERELLARVEAKALQELKARGEVPPIGIELLHSIEDSLTKEGQASLEALVELSVVLNQPTPHIERMGRDLVSLQAGLYDLEQAGDRISLLENHLNCELQTITKLVNELQGDAYKLPLDLAKQTNDYQRRSKALSSKLPELKDRVGSLQANLGSSNITIQDVKAHEDKFRELKATVRELEAEVKSFHGLPQDLDLARLELESLRAELQNLTSERDRMFEGLVERESPKKTRS